MTESKIQNRNLWLLTLPFYRKSLIMMFFKCKTIKMKLCGGAGIWWTASYLAKKWEKSAGIEKKKIYFVLNSAVTGSQNPGGSDIILAFMEIGPEKTLGEHTQTGLYLSDWAWQQNNISCWALVEGDTSVPLHLKSCSCVPVSSQMSDLNEVTRFQENRTHLVQQRQQVLL